MNITRECNKVKAEKWARYNYNLTTNIGENGTRVSGCKEHIELSRKVATEGMVLLENNGFLPIKENTTVALFGIGSIDYIKGGGGSGMVYCDYVRNIYEGFMCKAPKISVYEPVTKFYYDYAAPRISEYNGYRLFPEMDLPSDLLNSAAQNADVAIITIRRFSDEGSDGRSEKGDFYLSDIEQKMVDDVTAAFEHSIIVLDIGSMMDVSWIKSNPKIDAALIAWQAGMEGGLAIADIICGDVNPSGKLTDTFARTYSDYPSADTFKESEDYAEYYEDIYVGYRYFETIPNAKEKVIYPFGYGLSYTTFSLTKPVAAQVGNDIEVRLTVTNTGACPGKEVVQIYFSAPQGRLGKSAVSLAAFGKTRLLGCGESQDLVLTFPITQMASYDDLGKCQMSAYVLEQGEYIFYAGTSCRDLMAADYRYIVSDEYIVTEQLTQKCAPNKLGKRMLSDGSFEALPDFPIKEYDIPALVNPEKAPETEKPVPFIKVFNGEISMDTFIAQLTQKELIDLVGGIPNQGVACTSGMGGNKRLKIPAVMTADGPAGIRINPQIGIANTAWPCAALIACTWDPQLAYDIGRAGGLEAKESGLAIWLTPALNIHRNPLCGRNFEYFSEDPLIAGKFAAAKVRGIQSTNTAATPKHFAANNKETNRHYSDSRVSERALREIYLRGFEICVKESMPWIIMSSYNIINAHRVCECYELLQGILRNEWGFEGMLTTDWGVRSNHANCVLAGNDIRMPEGITDHIVEALNSGRLQRGHLEICVKRILEMLLKLD